MGSFEAVGPSHQSAADFLLRHYLASTSDLIAMSAEADHAAGGRVHFSWLTANPATTTKSLLEFLQR